MEIVRGRTLLAAFNAKETRLDGDVLSRCQVMRLWHRNAISTAPIITISFMKTGDYRGHEEYEVLDRMTCSRRRGSFVLDLGKSEKNKVQLQLSTREFLIIYFKNSGGT